MLTGEPPSPSIPAMLRAIYQRLPPQCRMAIGQLRRGRFSALRGDDPGLARAVWEDRGEEWAKMYWNDTDAPQRKVMLEAVEKVAPFKSLLELGCNSGPNLRLIQHRFPEAKLSGIEFSEDAVRLGRKQFDIRPGTFSEIAGSYDVILSMWSLCCSPPSEIIGVMHGIAESVRSAVVIIEPSIEGRSALLSPLPTWRHDYAAMFGEAGMVVETYPVSLKDIDRVIIARR